MKYNIFFKIGLLLFLYSLISCSGTKINDLPSAKTLPDVVDFNLHVKPILSDKCFACHGPDIAKRKADLRLDTKEGAYKTLLESGEYPIVPGDLHSSIVYKKIMSNDPDSKMPPPESNLNLSNYEREILKRWIINGAEYKPHWAFTKPTSVNIPEIKAKQWPTNAIDNFIEKKIEKNGIEHSERATKEELIRRITFDLTGLPPLILDIENFLVDNSPKAYEKVVDRLLASPHYGERMASEWLDVSRYSDSHGYQDDQTRTMWPWRDWVIDAYNTNIPYKDFVTWQLAGDMFPDASFEQKLASGFNRNHAITKEVGIIEEEYLTEYAADRVQTFGTAFVGLTLQCARCHDHKYDPISQKEFYQIFSFFNNITEKGRIGYNDLAPAPHIKYENLEYENNVKQIKEMLNKLELEQQNFRLKIDEDELKNWFQGLNWEQLTAEGIVTKHKMDFQEAGKMQDEISHAFSGTINYNLVPNTAVPIEVEGKFGKALEFDGTNTLTIGDKGDFEHMDKFSLGGWIRFTQTQENISGLISRRNGVVNTTGYGLYLDQDNYLRFQIASTLERSIDVRSKSEIPKGQWVNIFGTYDGSGKASGLKIYVNGKKQAVEVITDNLASKSILVGTQVTVGHWMVRATVKGQLGGFKGAVDDVSIYNRELSPNEVKYLFDKEPEYDSDLVYETYIKNKSTTLNKIDQRLDSLRRIDTDIPYVMVMEERDTIKPAFILARGAYDARGEQVSRGTPNAILEFSNDFPKNRIGLSEWLFDERNPLTSRVYANRIWQMLFGNGLVHTPEDFGNQGAFPTHPELLDWIALEFMNNGWDTKALIKMIVMSSTYCQSSKIDHKKQSIDSENIYLSRGPYKKLTAEMIRDQALAFSGLLDRKVGGKWVKPYQPNGIWKEMANEKGENKYRPSHGSNIYRRSLYTYWKRSIPVPSMLIFDASERAMCTVKRQTTSTPLQSLVLLNDPQYIEASRVLAEELIINDNDISSWINTAFKKLMTRNSSVAEFEILIELYKSELKRFEGDENGSLNLVDIGNSPMAASIDKNKLAALTVVISAMLNIDEARHF